MIHLVVFAVPSAPAALWGVRKRRAMAEQFNPPGRGSAVDQDYELFLHSVVRDINGLSEKDRNVRHLRPALSC